MQSNHSTEFVVFPPLVDILRSPNRLSQFLPNFTDALQLQVFAHQKASKCATQFLDQLRNHQIDDIPRTNIADFYQLIIALLKHPEYSRLLLFLPFECLPAPEDNSPISQALRTQIATTWQVLAHTRDIRAIFTNADIPEPEARTAEPERVIKVAHITPWLIKHRILSTMQIFKLIQDSGDLLLGQNFLETKELLANFELLSPKDYQYFDLLTKILPPRSPQPPLKFISASRKKWLEETKQGIKRPTTQQADLSAPLETQLPNLQNEIQIILEQLRKDSSSNSYRVAWLGGSRLKGHHQINSDLDIWIPTKELSDWQPQINSSKPIPLSTIKANLPDFAHLIFSCAWLGQKHNILELQRELLPLYFQDSANRSRIIERLEQDLLEFRLLHKGYATYYPDSNPEYKKYTSMDGESAFYETDYRIIAAKIYLNSIFLPHI